MRELARAQANEQTPLVFMHTYPGDLAADGEEIARSFAEATAAPGAVWTASVTLAAGLNEVTLSTGMADETIRILVRRGKSVPCRALPMAPRRDIRATGAGPERGVEGTQRGPNKSGSKQ